MSTAHIGKPISRVDGRAKVTGEAKYAAEYTTPGLAYGWVVSSPIARGKIVVDRRERGVETARGDPGLLAREQAEPCVVRLQLPRPDRAPRLPVPPALRRGGPFQLPSRWPWSWPTRWSWPDSPRRSCGSSTRPARTPRTCRPTWRSARTPKEREGIKPPPKPRGHADKALAASPVRVDAEYEVPVEHHNPMEMFATTVVRDEDGTFTVYDKTQGVQNVRDYLCNALGFKPDEIRVVTAYVGGAFGSGLRPQYQVFLAALAARELKRSVRVALTRQQMFSLGHRPTTRQRVALGASADGALQAVIHEATAETSRYEDYSEEVVNWSGLLYRCDNARFEHKVVPLDLPTPCDMRAPGAVWGLFALESAMDELAVGLGDRPRRAAAEELRRGGPERRQAVHEQGAQGVLPPGGRAVRLAET